MKLLCILHLCLTHKVLFRQRKITSKQTIKNVRVCVSCNFIGEKLNIVWMVVDDRTEMVSIPSSSIVSSAFAVHNNDGMMTTDDIE